MWDYNGDGVIDSLDDDEYWSDVYFEEHRDDYSSGFRTFTGNNTSSKVRNGSNNTGTEAALGLFTGIGGLILLIICLAGAVGLGILGIGCMFFFPPLGILLMVPLYKLLGGR